jgi:hypothetical protein
MIYSYLPFRLLVPAPFPAFALAAVAFKGVLPPEPIEAGFAVLSSVEPASIPDNLRIPVVRYES